MENALYDFLFTRWIKIVRAHFPWTNLYISKFQCDRNRRAERKPAMVAMASPLNIVIYIIYFLTSFMYQTTYFSVYRQLEFIWHSAEKKNSDFIVVAIVLIEWFIFFV